MLQAKRFGRDDYYDACPTRNYLPVSCFIPASQQCPVLRFQANVFPSRIVLVMSFSHFALDGIGAGTILEALAQCCKATNDGTDVTVAVNIAKTEVALRKDVSLWPSRCKTRLDHSRDMGPPVLDYSITSEQWAAMKAAMSSTIKPKGFSFSLEKVAQVKQRRKKSLPMLQPSSFISSNYIITAILGISVDRAQHPTRASNKENASITMTVDLRNRVQPPLPDTYVGNTAFPVKSNIYPPQDHQTPVEDAQERHSSPYTGCAPA